MSFANLGQVFPWLEMGHFFGQNLDSTRAFEPALFKSHMELSELPPGGKIINIIRNPGDTLMSYYNFWADVLFDRDEVSLDMMARQFFLLERSDAPRNMFQLNYYQHLVDFHTTEYDGPVLFVAYEDLKDDQPLAVRRIARFKSSCGPVEANRHVRPSCEWLIVVGQRPPLLRAGRIAGVDRIRAALADCAARLLPRVLLFLLVRFGRVATFLLPQPVALQPVLSFPVFVQELPVRLDSNRVVV